VIEKRSVPEIKESRLPTCLLPPPLLFRASGVGRMVTYDNWSHDGQSIGGNVEPLVGNHIRIALVFEPELSVAQRDAAYSVASSDSSLLTPYSNSVLGEQSEPSSSWVSDDDLRSTASPGHDGVQAGSDIAPTDVMGTSRQTEGNFLGIDFGSRELSRGGDKLKEIAIAGKRPGDRYISRHRGA